MRIYLKQAQQAGAVSYPAAGFYANVDDAQAQTWIDAGLALPATDNNEVIEPPTPAPSATIVESHDETVEGVHQEVG
jgi:hypothetical protein